MYIGNCDEQNKMFLGGVRFLDLQMAHYVKSYVSKFHNFKHIKS